MNPRPNTAYHLFNDLLDFIYAIFWNYVNGDVWWGLLRQIFLLAMVNLIAIAMADSFAVVNFMRVWHNLIFPTIIFTVGFWTYMFIVRDVTESGKVHSKIFRHFFFFFVFLAASIWVEMKAIDRIGMTETFIGYYLIAPLSVVIISSLIAAKYVQDIFNLESYSVALLYISSSFWGIAYPKLTVDDNQYQVETGKQNRLVLIGGPGYLTVKPGNAVIVNDLGVNSGIYSSKKVFLSHYGSVVSIIDLNNQRGYVPSVSATTKDGITITIRDIQFRYRIWSPLQKPDESGGRIKLDPYPFADQSVRDSVYNLVVTEDGLSAWSGMVQSTVQGQITSYITERQLDQIVTPNFRQYEPRNEIRRQLFSSKSEQKFKDIGAKLLWCDIGHFETDKAVLEQRLENWSAKWIGNAKVVRARGEAQKVAYQEIGRAEAQADMLMSIIHAFDDIDLSVERKDENIRKIIFMRSAQVLEALTSTKPLESNKKSSSGSANGSKGKDET